MTRLAINGFGRIGKMALRAIIEHKLPIEVVAVNDLGGPEQAAFLFEFDSTYGKFPGTVSFTEDSIVVNGKSIKVCSEREPENLPWKELGVDIVLECTGAFCKKEGASKHITAGAKKVIISAPAKDEVDATIVLGVNDEILKKEDVIISCASCTTNCLGPVVKVLHTEFGIVEGLMNTIHAYTGDQRLLDASHKDFRRARSAAVSIIPTKTGAAKSIGVIMPELKGKLDGFSLRVPTETVSCVDLTFVSEKAMSTESITAAFTKASEGELKGILGVEKRPLVSIDFRKDPRSSIVDAQSTRIIGPNFAKVVAWYDNEWGYACRLVELAAKVGALT